MSTPTEHKSPVLWPGWAGGATLILSGLGAVLALIVLVQGVREGLASGLVEAWFASSFALVMGVACAMGALAGSGRLRGAEPLTLLCVGGTLFVGAVLSDASLAARALGRPANSPVFVGMNMQWIMLGLLGVGLLMMGLSAVTTIARDRRASVPHVARGVAFAAPILAMAGLWKVQATRAMILNLPGWALAILALIGMVLLVVCASASVHYLVKGFGAAAHTRRGRGEAASDRVEGGVTASQQ